MKNRSREIIGELGIKKVDIAEKMGITPVGLNQILNTDKPKLETLEKLAKAINVPAWKLFLTDEEIKEINLIEDDTNNGELTALIQHKGEFYKTTTIAELEKIVEKIRMQEQ